MIAIPNMDKPKKAFECSTKINPEERMCNYTGKVFEETLSLLLDHPCDDCPLIEIVRCGECKFMSEHYDTDGNVPYWTCSEWDSGTDIDGYCYLGERRTNDKTEESRP